MRVFRCGMRLTVTLSALTVTDARANDVDLANARAAVAARLKSLQSLHVKYDRHEIPSVPEAMLRRSQPGATSADRWHERRKDQAAEEVYLLGNMMHVEVNQMSFAHCGSCRKNFRA